MSKKFVYPCLVFMPIILLFVWVGTILYQIYGSATVNVRILGYDPLDLLSGHYIRYTLDWQNTDCRQFAGDICPKALFNAYGLNYGRYYVPENLAKPLEEVLQNNENIAEIVFSYREGKQPFVLNLLVNGKEWRGVRR